MRRYATTGYILGSSSYLYIAKVTSMCMCVGVDVFWSFSFHSIAVRLRAALRQRVVWAICMFQWSLDGKSKRLGLGHKCELLLRLLLLCVARICLFYTFCGSSHKMAATAAAMPAMILFLSRVLFRRCQGFSIYFMAASHSHCHARCCWCCCCCFFFVFFLQF